MAQIAFILLCHKDPEAIIQQAGQLTAAGDVMAIHLDARAPEADWRRLREASGANPSIAFARRRVRCGWGELSLVRATLEALETATAACPRATHFYMPSGDCMAIKSAAYAHALLDADDADFIESFDFHESGWIRTGLREERPHYRHLFNERTSRRLFYWSLGLQRRLGLRREPPGDLRMMIGSQWWCLRRRTVEAVLRTTRERRDVVRFFRTTWIPDESFFQTLVRHLVPDREIRTRTLTFLLFTDYGMPVTFHDDHYDLLLGQDYLFARKIGAGARGLKARLGLLYASGREGFVISDEGRRLFDFLTGRGRVGRRFAPRFWETEATLGRGRELLVVTCKKWHVAKRVVRATGIPAVEYVFDEEGAALPDLGGIQSSLPKRARHRRALLRLLFDHWGTDRLVVCLGPANLPVMQDLFSDRSTARLLETECVLGDAYLAGHARRLGSAGERTPPDTLLRLLPTIRDDLEHERDRDAGFPRFGRVSETASAEENAQAIAAFLSVPPDVAQGLARKPRLFSD